ncbi:hypothetical protein [Clostridium estertheticum]|uniref:hypothetical protein n=1 Tax=Clostridium estertheticum TaxID=238834 RepID=UPI001C0CB1CD|nr:hypothetical protein [Clostridium estertheticum]MBU3073202.1 hypothetical protein [Clostridium estertheticum]MBU3163557.1 hypothetical protein [Clostridium estertheticum]
MKILFIDLLSPIGHKNYDYGILKYLSELCKVDILVRNNFLELEKNKIYVNDINYIPDEFIPEILKEKYKNINFYKIKFRIMQCKCMKWIKKKFDIEAYDLIFFSSVDIISFAISTQNIKTRCVFVDHSISDIDYSYMKIFFWRHINKKIDVVVMEPYIKNYIRDIIKVHNKIWTVPHPLPSINVNNYNTVIKPQNKKVIFAPGLSNDEAFIDFIINNQEKIPRQYKIIIRSEIRSISLENIEVYNKRISDEEYYGTMTNSSYVLLPYDEKYNYKTSGVFFESSSFNKPMLINNNNTLKNYNDIYPELIKLFDGFDDFLVLLEKIKKDEFSPNLDMFDKVLFDYSDEVIKKHLLKMIEGSSSIR